MIITDLFSCGQLELAVKLFSASNKMDRNAMNENINVHGGRTRHDIIRQPQKQQLGQTPQRTPFANITNSTPRASQQKESQKRKHECITPITPTVGFSIFEDGAIEQKSKKQKQIPSFYEDEIEQLHIPPPVVLPPVTLTHWDENGRPHDLVVSVEKNLHKLTPSPMIFSSLSKRSEPTKKKKSKERKSALLKEMPSCFELEQKLDKDDTSARAPLAVVETLPSFDWDSI